MNKEEILGSFSLVNNPIVLSEEEVKDVQKAIKQLQQENKQLKEIEKEHQKINGDLRIEIKELKEKYMKLEDKYIHNVSCCNEKDCDLFCELQELKDRINKIVEIIEKEIESLKDKKRMIMQILTPENGYLKTDVEYEIKRLERYLEILKGDKQ